MSTAVCVCHRNLFLSNLIGHLMLAFSFFSLFLSVLCVSLNEAKTKIKSSSTCEYILISIPSDIKTWMYLYMKTRNWSKLWSNVGARQMENSNREKERMNKSNWRNSTWPRVNYFRGQQKKQNSRCRCSPHKQCIFTRTHPYFIYCGKYYDEHNFLFVLTVFAFWYSLSMRGTNLNTFWTLFIFWYVFRSSVAIRREPKTVAAAEIFAGNAT